jgi:hypothetical protein
MTDWPPATGTLSTEFKFSGDYSERATPVPIPNTAVKPLSSDDTARATVWESRTLPGIMKRPRSNPRAFLFGPHLPRFTFPIDGR